MIKYSLYDPYKAGIRTKTQLPVSVEDDKYTFDYPCDDPSSCTDYSIELPPGFYKFELYGASGGSFTGEVSTHHYESGECIPDSLVKLFHGNTECLPSFKSGGAGGYVRGFIRIKHPTHIYATIGGMGQYLNNTYCSPFENCFHKENMTHGGYGGGGSSAGYPGGTASGGGQTSVQFLENSLYHRVIVSGAGGGSDDYGGNDGRGGSGGNLVAQGWWADQVYNGNYLANSSFGFTFGTGEAAQFRGSKNSNGVRTPYMETDRCGAGGGWFGGFASHHCNGGCGGGSSWVLTKDAYIPTGLIESRDEFYENNVSREYFFDLNSEYLFTEVEHVPGIWQGNGRLIITIQKPFISNNYGANSQLLKYAIGYICES